MGKMFDCSKEMLLDNILRAMDTEFFGRNKAAKLVGGMARLRHLVEIGAIDVEKPTSKQNGKWMCNAAQVLRHCRPQN